MTIKRYKLFVDFEKEEKWINKMSAKGWQLQNYTFLTYHFSEGKKGEYKYRLELLSELSGHEYSVEYIRHMEEIGNKMVCTWLRSAYFRRDSSEGKFNMLSDYQSRIAHYMKLIWIFGMVGGLNMIAGIMNIAISLTLVHRSGLSGSASINIILGAALIIKVIQYKNKIKRMEKERDEV